MLKKILFFTFAFALSAFASVGNISLLKGQADIARGSSIVPAENLMDIEQKDKVSTKEDSRMQITFEDKTVITLGALTNFEVEEYLIDSSNSNADFSITSGTFKVITGEIGKLAPKKFIVKTKTAYIGIRGTIFKGDLSYDDTDKDKISCLEGSITVTPIQEGNPVILNAGEMVIVHADGSMSNPTNIAGKANKQSKSQENIADEKLTGNEWNDDSLLNLNKTQRYSGKGTGTISQTQTTSSETINLSGNLKTDVSMSGDFSVNGPIELNFSNQQLNLTSGTINGASIPQSNLNSLSNQINNQGYSNLTLNSTINQSSLSAKETLMQGGITHEVSLNGSFGNDKFNGQFKQDSSGKIDGNSINSNINLNLDLSKN